MARQKGSLSLGGSLEPKVGAPLDARDRVPTLADLTATTSFPYSWIGMTTYVVSEGKEYRLVGSDPTVAANWEEVGSGGSQITVDPTPTENSTNAVQSGGTYTALAGKVDKVNGKGLSTEDYTTADKTKLAGIDLSNYVPTSDKGANNGVATLGANGKIPMSQIPSGLDEIVEGYRNPTDGLFYEDSAYQTAITGGSGIIYYDIQREVSGDTIGGLYWRWNGTAFVTFGDALVLGEVTGTAYDGGKGKGIRDDVGNLTNLTTTEKGTLVGAINEVNQNLTFDATPTEGSTKGVQSGGVYTALGNKVDKVQGKGLSTNDYDNTEKGKVSDAATHIGSSVVNASGVHGFKVDTSGTRDKILYNDGGTWTEIPLGDIFRVSTMPSAVAGNVGNFVQYVGTTTSDYVHGYFYECVSDGEPTPTYSWVNREVQDGTRKSALPTASVDYLGIIYQYVGATTQDLKKGFFYECVLDGATYKWSAIRVQSGGGQTIQYDVVPQASGENVGQIIQYTGTTNANYTNGFFYKCVASESGGVTTYSWENQLVQTGGDTRVKPEILEIGVSQSGTTFTPYIKFLYELPAFNQLTWDEVIAFAQMYYDGDLPLSEIQDAWNIGDTLSLNLGAIGAYSDTSYIPETHAAQTVEMTIIDFNHDPLKTAIGAKSNALLTLQMKDCLNEACYWDLTDPGWQEWSITKRRDWCNTNVYDAIPSNVQTAIKMVSRNNFKTSSGNNPGEIEVVDDKIFIPTLYEVMTVSSSLGFPDGTRYPYYDTTANRVKKVNNVNGNWWTSRDRDGAFMNCQMIVTSTGESYDQYKRLNSYNNADIGISFAFCI